MKRYDMLEEFIAEAVRVMYEIHAIDKSVSVEFYVDVERNFGRYYLKIQRVFTYDEKLITAWWINWPDQSCYREYLNSDRKPQKECLKRHIDLFLSQLWTFKFLCKNSKIPFKADLIDNMHKEDKLLEVCEDIKNWR